ncbi:Lysozyme-like domain protein, partial [Metarhizium majus ARSEF 297]
MKTNTLATLAGLAAAAAAYPVADHLWARACTPGALMCSGTTQFALCVAADSTPQWMKVSEGTQCVCSGSECTITSINGTSAGAGAPGASGASGASPTAPMTSAPAPEETPAQSASVSAAVPTSAPPAGSSLAPSSSPVAVPAPSSDPVPVPSSDPAPVPSSAPVPAPSSDPAPVPSSASAPAPSSAPASAPSSAPAPAPSSGAAPAPSSGAGPAPGAAVPYKLYLGNGSPADGWPTESKWPTFEALWTINLPFIKTGCDWQKFQPNSEEETAELKSAIQSVGQSGGVDPRFILAIVMQESNGCVRVGSTANGVANPGLMQSHAGPHSCFNKPACSKDEIEGMIKDGTLGTPSGDGLKQVLVQAGPGEGQFYRAARIYNSGRVAAGGALQLGIGATNCYSTDIANRLSGWNDAVTPCHV